MRDRRRVAQPQRLAEVVHRQAGVDDVDRDEHVAAADVAVEILDESHAALAAVERLELDEVQLVRKRHRAREIDGEDEAAAKRDDEHEVAAVVVARDLGAELACARKELARRQVGLARAHEARSTRSRSASRSTSRL